MSIEAPASIAFNIASSIMSSATESITSGLSSLASESSFSFNPSLGADIPAPEFSINTPNISEITNPFSFDTIDNPIQHALLPDLFSHDIQPGAPPKPGADQLFTPTESPLRIPFSILDSLRQKTVIEINNPFSNTEPEEQIIQVEYEGHSRIKTHEQIIDKSDIDDAIVLLDNDDEFSDEEKNMWGQKLLKIKGEKLAKYLNPEDQDETIRELIIDTNTAPLAATQTIEQSCNKTSVQTSTEVDSGIPQKPKAPSATSEDNPDPIQEDDKEESVWDEFTILRKISLAQRSLKKRYILAQEMVSDSIKNSEIHGGSIVDYLFGGLIKFEIPDIEEFADIIRGKLDLPTIIPRAEIELSIIQEDDAQAAQKALIMAIDSAFPTEKNQQEIYEGRKKQSDLPEAPRELANYGAKNIVLDKGIKWIDIDPRKSTEPIELEKVDEVA